MGRALIPALAIGGLGIATGGFGLFGAAATPGLAGATAVTSATGALAGSGTAAGTVIGGTALAAPAGLAASLPSWLTVGNALSAAGAVSSLAGGIQGQQSAEFLQAQYAEEEANAKAAAAQDELQRRRQLNSVLATQRAIFAGRGTELFGGSQMKIQERTKIEAEEDIETSTLNYLSRARRYNLASGQAGAQGRQALLGGVGGAAKSLAPLVT